MHIRNYTNSDAVAMAALLRASVSGLAGAYYSQAQIKAWLDVLPDADKIRTKNRDGRQTFMIEHKSGDLCGFIDLEPDGHIDFLYVSPDHAGRGLASKLYGHLESFALKRGITRLYTEASESARPVFLTKGFTEINRRDFEIVGVMIHNYAMEKTLY